MSFFGVFILLMVLGGLVLLVLYSLLAMAAKGDEYDEYLDQLELEQYPVREYAPPLTKTPKGENQRISVCRPPPICPTVAPPKLGFSSNVESAKTLVGVLRLRFPLIRQDSGLRWGKPG